LFAFSWWTGKRWRATRRQMYALALEAKRPGIPVHVRRKLFNRRDRRTAVTWKLEVIIVKGKNFKTVIETSKQDVSSRSLRLVKAFFLRDPEK